jgi:hypothetical protein
MARASNVTPMPASSATCGLVAAWPDEASFAVASLEA